jgi:uncharacterized membrane protein YbhN (UPF0104 family)
MMPLGLGGYDISLISLLLLLGIDTETALLTPIFSRLSMLAVISVLGAISMVKLGINPFKQKSH